MVLLYSQQMKKQKQLLKINSIGNQPLHKSQLSSSLGQLASLGNVHSSFISANDEKLSDLSNSHPKIQYKYERVNNMFKLVEVKSNHEDQFKEKPIHELIEDLTKRIQVLEKQQKIKANDQDKLYEMVQNNNNKSDYLEEKIDIALSNIKQFKHQFVEIQQKQTIYEEGLADIKKICFFVSELKQQLNQNLKEVRCLVEEKVNNLQKQMKDKLYQLKVEKGMIENPENGSYKKKLIYRQTYSYQDETYLINEKIYFIDDTGKLLDQFGFYLTDENQSPIYLNEYHISKLKEYGILS